MVVHTGCERRRGWHEGDMVAGMVVILAMVAKWGWCRGLALVLRWSGEAEVVSGLGPLWKFPAWASFGSLPTRCSTKWPNEIYF